MKRLAWISMLAAAAACGSSDNHSTDASTAFTLGATDLANGTFSNSQISNIFGCTGGNQSPALTWSNPPAGTKSFVLTMFDPDAPTGSGFWHWTVFDIPAGTTSLSANAAAGGLPAGAIQGYTDYGISGYGGPCPPSGDTPHRYLFTLTAVNTEHLGLTATSPAALVSFSAHSMSLGTAMFTASYGIGTPGTTMHPEPPTMASFKLSSAEVAAGGTFANDQVLNAFGCTGNNISPSLVWTGAPADTLSYALTIYDPDAPTGSGFWHWLVLDIPATASSLSVGAGAAGGAALPAGTIQAYNDTGASAYAGPCPPAGDPAHHYVFTLYSFNIPSLTAAGSLTAMSTGGVIGFNTRAMATAKATFTAMYGR